MVSVDFEDIFHFERILLNVKVNINYRKGMSTIPISLPNHDETPFSRDESAVWRDESAFLVNQTSSFLCWF